MSILIPIELASDAAAAATLFGSTSFGANATVDSYLPASRIIGTTTLIGLLGQDRPVAGTINGSTSLRARVRLNDEPDDLLEALIAGQTDFRAAPAYQAPFAATFPGRTFFTGSFASTAREDVLMLYITVTNTQQSTISRYRARLVVGTQEVPLLRWRASWPTGVAGVHVDAEIPAGELPAGPANFEIGLWTGTTWQWQTIITAGEIVAVEEKIAWNSGPTDTRQIQIIDSADRFVRAPDTPIILYDPTLEQIGPIDTGLTDESGTRVYAKTIPVAGMTLHDVLDYVYVQGCGFTRIETTVPAISIARVDISIEGGYHQSVQPFLAPFDPLMFVDHTGALWILDSNAPVPATLASGAFELTVSDYQWLETGFKHEPVSGLIVSYQDDTSGDFYTERIEQETPIEAGRAGDPDYTQTTITRRIREWRTQIQPTRIVREQLLETTEETRDSRGELVSRIRQQERYDSLGRKNGHTRTVYARIPNATLDGLELAEVEREECSIFYGPHPLRPREIVQTRSITQVRGLVYVDTQNQYLAQPFKLQLLDAHRSGLIAEPLAPGQNLENAPLRTITETLRIRSDGEIDVVRTVIDHLARTVERTAATPRTGEIRITDDVRGARVMLSRGTPGKWLVWDAGRMPFYMAIELGRRRLAKLDRRAARARLPRWDPAIRRGLICQMRDRVGDLGTFIITGYSVNGGSEIVMDLELHEVETL